VNRKLVLVSCVLGIALLATSFVSGAWTSSSMFGTRFKVGETVEFRIEDQTTWFWGCCACEETMVLGWRVVSSSGGTIYSVMHDAPVSSSLWQGSWSQTDISGVQVAVGEYMIYVDTSVGTLSRCFKVYDPCNRCYSCPTCTVCTEVSTITDCACRTSLVFVESCTGCFPLFGWFGGCCSPCASSTGGCP